MRNVNCKQYDVGGWCNKKPKIFFGMARPECCEAETPSTPCDVAERFSRPPTPPAPQVKKAKCGCCGCTCSNKG